ncbi:podocalyxin [Anomaloglossus baeobatrachus]|uniref:podocalyxin n=1 Tax=Anomaloglossus baeobatrachus TaxID=238106 RepID=UPI003F4FD3FE
MTKLGYLLLFLCALGIRAQSATTPSSTPASMPASTPTSKPTSKPTTVATSEAPLPLTTQVTTTTNKISTVAQSTLAVPSTAAAPPAPTTQITPTLAKIPVGTPKPSTTAVSGSQDATQPTAKMAPTTAGAARSTSAIVRTTNNKPTSVNPTVKPTQPETLPKASTPVLKSSSEAEGKSQSNITESAMQPVATSHPFTPGPAIDKNVTNYSTTKASSSEVSPSPMTLSKTTAGIISDSTADSTDSSTVIKDASPNRTPSVNYTQENIEVSCKKEHKGSLVKINIKSSRICGENANKDEEDAKEILKHICTALKPGYQPSKDKCHIDLGEASDKLVIVDAYVQSFLQPDDLYASLKHIKKDSFSLFQFDESKFEEEDVVSIPLISAIVSLAVALLIIAAIYGCWHQRQIRKREQRLTEELQTMENGYHDNPTLEVMETSPEMQEKKGGPNGELGDSWIVPLDNLTREDLDDEEDTHL